MKVLTDWLGTRRQPSRSPRQWELLSKRHAKFARFTSMCWWDEVPQILSSGLNSCIL